MLKCFKELESMRSKGQYEMEYKYGLTATHQNCFYFPPRQHHHQELFKGTVFAPIRWQSQSIRITYPLPTFREQPTPPRPEAEKVRELKTLFWTFIN
jgi:hypothetical protein